MNTLLSSQRSDKIQLDWLRIAQWGLVAILALITLYNVYVSMLENVAHDAMPYMEDYVGKFVSEGRWINFGLFHVLKELPQVLAVSLCSLFVFVFGYQVANGMRKEAWLAVAFALLLVNVPYFTMLFKWPMTLVPGMALLALFSCLTHKLPRNTFLLLSGVLLFATYPAFYFLMPLLFIRDISRASFKEFALFMLVWMAGYVLGYLVANVSVYIYTYLFTDHPSFIEFVSWRKSTPTSDFDSLISNIMKSAGNFERNALYLADLSPWFFVPVALTTLWALKNHFKYTLVVLMVVFSIYASVIAMGVKVPLRSGITLPIGLAMMILLVENRTWRTLLLVSLFVPFAYKMHHYNDSYNEKRILTEAMLTERDTQGYLQQPDRFDKIIISADNVKTSEYFYQLTKSDAYKNLTNLELHYLRPYLYQYGWKDKNIDFLDKPRDSVNGEAYIDVKGRTLYVDIK